MKKYFNTREFSWFIFSIASSSHVDGNGSLGRSVTGNHNPTVSALSMPARLKWQNGETETDTFCKITLIRAIKMYTIENRTRRSLKQSQGIRARRPDRTNSRTSLSCSLEVSSLCTRLYVRPVCDRLWDLGTFRRNVCERPLGASDSRS